MKKNGANYTSMFQEAPTNNQLMAPKSFSSLAMVPAISA